MKISTRESYLALAAVSAVLVGVTAVLGRGQFEEWKELRKQQAEYRESIERNRRLLDQKQKWVKKMEKYKGMMLTVPHNKKMDVFLSEKLEKLAGKHGLKIIKHEIGRERREGPIYELPIECRDWEGTTDSLVHFLFDLQDKDAMLDIRYLRVKPKSKTIRKGRFSLYCAYMREPGKSK